MSLVQVEALEVRYKAGRVLRGVSFAIERGETLALVGESGSGKTTAALALLGLLAPGASASGAVTLDGHPMLSREEAALAPLRGKLAGMVFQDPATSFDPVMRVGTMIVQSVRRHRGVGRAEARRIAVEMLRAVGVPAPESRIDAYPHQLSGGLRQRAMIALALVNDPPVLIADEPTTALDATIQRQVLALLAAQAARRATLLVTHDLGVAAELAQRVAVLYHGRVVETGPTAALLLQPRHPYTAALLALVPRFDGVATARVPIQGAPPPAGVEIEGCAFRPRCRRATAQCLTDPVLDGGPHPVACWHPHG